MVVYLAHIEAHNPKVNAIVSRRDGDALLGEADAGDRQLARGESMVWLDGIPHAIKGLTQKKDAARGRAGAARRRASVVGPRPVLNCRGSRARLQGRPRSRRRSSAGGVPSLHRIGAGGLHGA
jgi:hypothetical protein